MSDNARTWLACFAGLVGLVVNLAWHDWLQAGIFAAVLVLALLWRYRLGRAS